MNKTETKVPLSRPDKAAPRPSCPEIEARIRRTNRMYPWLMGLSTDLMFWAAINILFLTTVKGLDASEVSLLSAIGYGVSIVLKEPVYRIIRRIGNLRSFRLGLAMLLAASVLIMLGRSFAVIAVGEAIYQLSFYFKNMDAVILKNNLRFLHEEDRFVEMQRQVSLVYALITMGIAFIAGFVFNLNHYLPMLICACICLFTLLASGQIYAWEPGAKEIARKPERSAPTFRWTGVILLILLTYGLVYATLELAHEQGKLFIQYRLGDFLDEDRTALLLSVTLALSRVSRVISNALFGRVLRALGKRLLLLYHGLLIAAMFLMLLGNRMPAGYTGILVMGLGFALLLWVRDPIMIFLKNELLRHAEPEVQQKAMVSFNLCNKIARCSLALTASLLLRSISVAALMGVLTGLLLLFMLLSVKTFRSLKAEG